MSSTQTHWMIDTPQGLEGMQNHYWKGEHPFFVGLCSDTGWELLWVEVSFDFVRRLYVLPVSLDVRLDCGSAGTGLYVVPFSRGSNVGTEEGGE